MRPSNTHDFTIRPATSADVDRLCEFAQDFLAKMHTRATGEQARVVFQQILRHEESGVLLVAEHKAGICAYAYASFQWRSESGGEMMDLVELFVEQAWRNKGVAASLIAALLDTARRRGIRRICAQVHPGNAAIERMLESAGFDPEHRTFWGLHI